MSATAIAELRVLLAATKYTYLGIRQREDAARREVEGCEKERYGLYDTAYTTWSMLRKLGDTEQGERLGLEDSITGSSTRADFREHRGRSLVHELDLVVQSLRMVLVDEVTSVR